jgi:hypothetical protein
MVFCATTPAAVQYLCDTGIDYYQKGNYDEALKEFNKVLILDSTNQTALTYKNSIIERVKTSVLPETLPVKEPPVITPTVTKPQVAEETLKNKEVSRGDVMESVFRKVAQPQVVPKPPKPKELSREEAMANVFAKVAQPTEKAKPKPIAAPVPVSKPQAIKETQKQKVVSREKAMEKALVVPTRKIAKKEEKLKEEPLLEGEVEKKKPGLKISGEAQASFGVSPDDFIWKRANFNLNEEDARIFSNAAFNNRTNTYDPRIFDRLRVNLDTENEEGLNFHGNITVDPWSFTGKSNKITITSPTGVGDQAEIELKYWSNTGYTIDEIIYTLENGASIAIPEIKVISSKTESDIPVVNTWGQRFVIPELKIHREFQPLRELWVDYNQPDSFKIRFFPMAYQDQALTFNDPLRLSNNHMWWEGSPWLNRWAEGTKNTLVAPVDFTKGKWDDSLAFATRDSDGTRLTALRGLSFEMTNDAMSLASTFATPKTLWQDYGKIDNLINATRFNYRLLDNLSLGALYTYRVGFNEHNKRDISNYVWGVDSGYEPIEGVKVALEVATSRTHKDITSPGYASKYQGNAYSVSLTGAFPRKSLMDFKNGYYEIKPEEGDSGLFARYRFYATRMDKGFDPTLSNYHQTRNDSFWSRHIQFRKPFNYFYESLYSPTLNWDDVEPFRIGNGIDSGRSVLGFRLEASTLEKKLDNLFDVRNVHDANGKFIENVARDELTYKFTDKLTSKALGIYQRLPRTHQGTDPFIIDSDTGEYVANADIKDGLNPTLKTGSLGLEYAFTEWMALSGIWEHTNDSTLAYNNWPRGDLSSTTFGSYSEYGRVYRREIPFLYQQTLFPLPPYNFYNIYKTGLKFDLSEALELYLDYTRNEFKSAGQIDDNINHVGLEAAYRPTKKLGFYFKYIYSRWNDVNLMMKGADHYYLGHHDVFFEFRYLPTGDDELIVQYGDSGRANIATKYTDPFNLGMPTLDTQHIFRTYYRRKF